MILKSYIEVNSFVGSVIVGRDDNSVFFLCVCGNNFSIKLSSQVKTDGYFKCRSCYNSGFAPFPGERHAFRRVRKDARARGLPFDIPFEFFKEKCHEPCHYCGESDGNSISIRSKVEGRYIVENFRYNGLDRKDNNLGYTEDNCVPACIICNRAKREMPYDEFIEWINRLVWFRNGTKEQTEEE